ncbi:GNAT family N-acetyltransferase [Aquihabitans daechungensis]|uniref:GNAT family N-acetyltransferase n=1 Tax=Aquihabitans daechungensis TaxID=1052257 RepID=UPI003BA00A86
MAADDRWWGARAHLQVAAWRGTSHTVVLSPVPDRPAPGPADIRQELDLLASRGVERVLTGALHQGELAPFLAAGFVEHERLHLLRHDLRTVPPSDAPVRLRRAWRRDQPEILAIDEQAFDTFWALDGGGLDDAVRATPASRFRVSTDRAITGYAITGRAADRGYLQRLAVDPARHREGIGAALVADSIRWLRRTGARVAVVNTQERNDGALALYLATGFVLEPHGLTVLSYALGSPRP